MGPENEQTPQALNVDEPSPNSSYLQKFKLYETCSKFYFIGWNKSRTFWRVLKIDRSEPSELNILEDSTSYSESDCCDLLSRIHDGNKSTGGLKFVTTCYGIIGFIKFLGPYYMLLITKRKKIGVICGHSVYAITKSKMIPIPNSIVRSNMAISKNENRYKKLLCTVDLTKDFFFSYSYHVMCSVQKNLSNYEARQCLYETMFVWNEFLTRGIRSQLNNTLWTVALVYGFFKQVKLSISGRDITLTLIARRSRHYAGTRFLKRGVNKKGRVANDVETEQIVLEDVTEGCSMQISSVVQNRGSIPLFWSQETSRLNIKPDIIFPVLKDPKYEATRLHFENLVKRYGNPVIILNLIKTREKKPRETILGAEFANAIEFLNKSLTQENCLIFLRCDLSKYYRNKTTNALARLHKLAEYAFNLTGLFYCQGTPNSKARDMFSWSYIENNTCGDHSLQNDGNEKKVTVDLDLHVSNEKGNMSRNHSVRPLMFQKGVVRTNCIDCIDRTNAAQYAYGLVAFCHQLHALGFIHVPNGDLDSHLADELMRIYESMGDTLALQYGGSAAHNKIFSERRGQWKAATQSQEFFRTLQRYYSNTYMDGEKQDAINVFLGHFQPQQGKPALWELDSDQHYNVGRRDSDFADENTRSFLKRSISDGNFLRENGSPIDIANLKRNADSSQPLPQKAHGDNTGLSESTPEISTCESDISYSSYHRCPNKHGVSLNCSNFLDMDWQSSSGNSCEEETCERSTVRSSGAFGLSSDNVVNGLIVESNTSATESVSSLKGRKQTGSDLTCGGAAEFSDSFVQWVTYGETLFP